MAVRIYALAKELKIDSKELVELCAKAGVTGKGSALASLADDEVVRLKEYLNNRNRPPERPAPAAPIKTLSPVPAPLSAPRVAPAPLRRRRPMYCGARITSLRAESARGRSRLRRRPSAPRATKRKKPLPIRRDRPW